MTAALVAALARLVCGPRVAWHCDPHATQQRIYFANHASHLDFVVLWASLPAAQRNGVRPVAGRDYWERTALRRYMARAIFKAILIERPPAGAADRAENARRAVDFMAREMGRETSLIVFPEGTRSEDGIIKPFKSGLYHLAGAVPGAALIPVYLHNLNRILPRGEMLPVPMLSRVTFGAPLRPAPGESKDVFLGRARAAVEGLKGTA
jgi:1-acyl-sn-glycerol-3-phosphate acyltransferase